MTRRRAAAALVWSWAAVMTATAPADVEAGVRDLADGWMRDVPEAVADSSAAAIGPWVACGTARLHGMAALPLRRLAAGWRERSWGVRGSWQVVGGDMWREDDLRLGAGAGRTWRWGLVGEIRRQRYGEVAGRTEIAAWPRLTISTAGIALTVVGDPIVAVRGDGARGPRPWLGVAVDRDGWSADWRWDRDDAGAVSWRAGVRTPLAGGVTCGVLVDAASGAVGVTTSWRRGPLLVRTSHLAHPALGVTHRWEAVLVTRGRR